MFQWHYHSYLSPSIDDFAAPGYLNSFLERNRVPQLLLGTPRLELSTVKGFSSMKAYTHDLNFWVSSTRSFAGQVWGNQFSTSIVKIVYNLLVVSTSKVRFE
jgi:hypothetical protein